MTAPSDDGGTDWRRLASERNVPHSVARALWQRACAGSPDDPAQAEHAFLLMLDEAEAANLTQEPGRETLADSAPDARDASSLGPGKWTRVLLEQAKPARSPGVAQRGAETGKRPSAEELRNEIAAAGQAGKNAAALLAASDPATIVEALRELTGGQGAGVLQKLLTVAGSAIERMLAQQPQAPQTQTGPAVEGSNAGDEAAQPAAADPTAAQPAAADPTAAQPAAAPSPAAQPSSAAEPSAAEPSAGQSSAGQPPDRTR
jgi:hypothetical protein